MKACKYCQTQEVELKSGYSGSWCKKFKGYYVFCPFCYASGPIRPKQVEAIQLWDGEKILIKNKS